MMKNPRLLEKKIKKLENIAYPSIEWRSKDITTFDADVTNAGYANYPMFQLAKGDTITALGIRYQQLLARLSIVKCILKS